MHYFISVLVLYISLMSPAMAIICDVTFTHCCPPECSVIDSPEVDAASGSSAFALVIGSLALLGEQRRRNRPA